jgi:osmotically-inducible protein OsmY
VRKKEEGREPRSGCRHREEQDAALIQNKLHDNVKYEVKRGVVTLTGEVNSQSKRDYAESVTRVPNVKQVVNDPPG